MGLYIYYGLIWFKKGMICWDNTGILMDIPSDND